MLLYEIFIKMNFKDGNYTLWFDSVGIIDIYCLLNWKNLECRKVDGLESLQNDYLTKVIAEKEVLKNGGVVL